MVDEIRYGYQFSWGRTTIGARGYKTREEADASFLRGLDHMGYRAPRWWEFWRWGENIPAPMTRSVPERRVNWLLIGAALVGVGVYKLVEWVIPFARSIW